MESVVWRRLELEIDGVCRVQQEGGVGESQGQEIGDEVLENYDGWTLEQESGVGRLQETEIVGGGWALEQASGGGQRAKSCGWTRLESVVLERQQVKIDEVKSRARAGWNSMKTVGVRPP